MIRTLSLYIFLLMILACLWGCATTARIGAYKDYDNDPDMLGKGAEILIIIDKPITDRYTCSFFHFSHLKTGWPFNHEPETTSDALGCSARIW